MPRHRPYGKSLRTVFSVLERVNTLGQAGDSRYFKQAVQRQFNMERAPYPRHHLGGQQRVASQLEEVVVHPDPLSPEEICPEAGHRLFHG
jgi:hypothetical protein